MEGDRSKRYHYLNPKSLLCDPPELEEKGSEDLRDRQSCRQEEPGFLRSLAYESHRTRTLRLDCHLVRKKLSFGLSH